MGSDLPVTPGLLPPSQSQGQCTRATGPGQPRSAGLHRLAADMRLAELQGVAFEEGLVARILFCLRNCPFEGGPQRVWSENAKETAGWIAPTRYP
jgi:hypothetical protein